MGRLRFAPEALSKYYMEPFAF